MKKTATQSPAPSPTTVGQVGVLSDQRGFALITSLMLTMISLVIVMALMYVITKGTEFSGFNKRYRSVVQATDGGTETITKEMIKRVFEGYSTSSALKGFYAASMPSLEVSDCFGPKVNRSSGAWPSGCDSVIAPNQNPDLTFLLQSATSQPFKIYAKVVDTHIGNTEQAELSNLRQPKNPTDTSEGGGGVTIPYTYRLEIQGERANNPQERSQLSVLYAY